MKVILDTNVLLSGVFFDGTPGRVLDLWKQGKFQLVASPEILGEYATASDELARKFLEIDLSKILETISAHAEIYFSPPLDRQVCDDPTDDKFLACAVVSVADVIVTGDKALLRIGKFGATHILTARQFMLRFEKSVLLAAVKPSGIDDG